MGEPGYDINVFYRSGQLVPGDRFVFDEGFGYQPVMDWLARMEPGKFGVGIAHDLQGPTPGHGMYVNPNGIGVTQRNGFFEALDEAEAGARSAAIVRLDAEPNAPFFLMTSSPTFVKAKWVPGTAPLSKIYQSCDAKLLR